MVDDGFHSAEVESAPFSASNPPLVTWVWPADGSVDAPMYTQVMATFQDAMDPGTIGPSTFTLTSGPGEAIDGAVTYSPEIQQATFTPDGVLEPGETYEARLAGSIEDALGQSLAADQVWTFRVEGGRTYCYIPFVVR